MSRTITVKGIGKVTAVPDCVIIYISIDTHAQKYDDTLEIASQKIENLNDSLEKIGFGKKAVKTTSFNVRTDYERVEDKNRNYRRVFNGYVCTHRLKVEFELDNKMIEQILCSISNCFAKPEISISFTVKDPLAVNEELLKSATINAREKARILCEASEVKIGNLISINYDWGELNIVSQTDYMIDEKCMAATSKKLSGIDIEPDDIDLSDTATFVWEIE